SRLVTLDDDSDVRRVSYPYATLLDGIPRWVRSYRLPFPLHGLMVSLCRGESASPLHLRDRNFTCTRLKLSKTSQSLSSILDYENHFGGTGRSHSCRKAVSGSTFVARRAGAKQASRATPTSSRGMETNVAGSVALTSKSSAFISLVSAKAPARPSPIPALTSFIPCPRTRRITSPVCAPSAIRTPISCVRCVTDHETTP